MNVTKSTYATLFTFTSILILSSCGGNSEPAFFPKPKGFHRILFPAHQYQQLNTANLPYTFEYSKHAKVLKDTSYKAEKEWIHINYPAYDATISITYKPILNNMDSLLGYTNTSHRLTGKHQVRASAITETVVKTKQNLGAVLFELEGEVPSPFQFYVTDTTENFLRAVLYFETSTKNDSLAPVINYIKEDMVYMLNTLSYQ